MTRRGQAAFAGARVGVIGLGASGLAAADVLATLGAHVLGVDAGEDALEAARAVVAPARGGDVTYVHAPDPQAQADAVAEVDLLVVSPGISPLGPLYREAARRGTPVWSEIELAWHVQAPLPGGDYAPWLALTGTNGKTTTVSMLSAILEADGRTAPAVGNVGTPAVEVAARGGVDALPAELSSFQLHSTHSLAPLASVVLNIAPDHLDWHGGYEAYRADKARIYERTTGACLFTPDPQTRAMVEEADVAEGARAVGVTLGAPSVSELGVVEDVLCDRAFTEQRWSHAVELASLADLAHLAPGGADLPPHVLLDALVAAGLARAAGVAPASVRDALREFSSGGHRIETVAEAGGVTWVDDSKATNAHAVAASLASLAPGTAVWIAGGVAKGARFEDLVDTSRDRLHAVVLLGTDRAPLREALASHAPDVPVVEIDAGADGRRAMAEAVAAAQTLARPGDTVLLAPACSSFDQFASYADRGEAFADAVRDALGEKR